MSMGLGMVTIKSKEAVVSLIIENKLAVDKTLTELHSDHYAERFGLFFPIHFFLSFSLLGM